MTRSRTAPMSCRLALSRRPNLVDRFETALKRLEDAGRTSVVRSFRTVLARGRVAINMSTPNLKRFLEQGHWLNIYEAVAKEDKLKGKDLNHEVRKRLQGFAEPRQALDKLFRFRRNTHYASLNLGGAGPQRYGFFCVVFKIENWSPFHTCFAGDSIRACFRKGGTRLLTDEEVLQGLALGADLDLLAVVRYEEFLRKQQFCVDPRELRNMVEASDSLLELHLHGPVRRSQILEVLMSRSFYDQLCDLSDRIKSCYDPEVLEFDKFLPFMEVLRLLNLYRIPLVVAE